MSIIEFRIASTEIANALPDCTPEQRRDWGNLTDRANYLAFPPTMQRGPQDTTSVVTYAEARNVARLVSQGGHRLYPGEQALVPFMEAITRPVDGSGIRELAACHGPVIPLPVRQQPTSVPVASITESDLNALARRLAETRPGSDDGNRVDLRLTDLSTDPSSMTGSELDLCRRIRNKYFPVTYSPTSVTESFEVPFFRSQDGRVSAVLHRETTMNLVAGSSVYVNDRTDSKHIDVTVPRGARLVVTYGDVSTVKSKPTTATDAGDVYRLPPGSGQVVCIKVVAPIAGDTAGVPTLLNVFGARMPLLQASTRSLPRPEQG